MKVPGAAAALGAFTLIVLGAGTASADNCTGIKIKAIGKKESRLLSCSAKEAVKGTVGVEPDCDNKAITKFMTAYDKPGACGDPPSADCELVAEDCRDKVRMALPDGDAMTPSPCESKRLKAAGKKASRKLKCYAKAAAKGQPVDSAPGGCLDKASTKFMTAFNAQSGCTGDGNETSIETLIDNECVNQLVTVDGMGHVTGICAAVATTTTTTTSTTTTTTGAACNTPQMCHNICTAGAAQCASCSDCANIVCAEDPTCCDPNFGWTSLCVSEVDTFCCPSNPSECCS